MIDDPLDENSWAGELGGGVWLVGGLNGLVGGLRGDWGELDRGSGWLRQSRTSPFRYFFPWPMKAVAWNPFAFARDPVLSPYTGNVGITSLWRTFFFGSACGLNILFRGENTHGYYK